MNKPSIPSIPISWNNAKRLLEEIGHGKHRSESHIRLYNEVDEKVIPIWVRVYPFNDITTLTHACVRHPERHGCHSWYSIEPQGPE
jgi:hypothetical protein